MFGLIYLNRDNHVKNILPKSIIYVKMLSKIMTSSSMERTFMMNPLFLIFNQKKEIRKLTTAQVEDYTTDYTIDYEYVKKSF